MLLFSLFLFPSYFICIYCEYFVEQFQGLWKTKNQNMADLCEEAKELGKKFLSFQIEHVLRVRTDTSYFEALH